MAMAGAVPLSGNGITAKLSVISWRISVSAVIMANQRHVTTISAASKIMWRNGENKEKQLKASKWLAGVTASVEEMKAAYQWRNQQRNDIISIKKASVKMTSIKRQ